MGRRREPSLMDDLYDVLQHVPSYVGPALALIAFVLLRFIAPLFVSSNSILKGMTPLITGLAWIVAFLILVAWIGAEIQKFFNRRRLDVQTGPQSIRELSWRDFEHLVAEAFRRQGFMAEVVGSPAGDGGVDIVLSGADGTSLVQCKQWRAWSVGVKPVRELLGVVVNRGAAVGILVTSGRFTNEAVRFAQGNSRLQLMDGPALARLVEAVRRSPGRSPAATAVVPPSFVAAAQQPAEPARPTMVNAPPCPVCGTKMVRRTARRGSNAGSHFWGCTKYPSCRGTRPN